MSNEEEISLKDLLQLQDKTNEETKDKEDQILDHFDLKSVLGQRRKQCWTADEAVTNCSKCKVLFSWCLRKHHCRACGEIFCHKCCSNSDILPRSVEQFPSRVFTSRQPTPPPASPPLEVVPTTEKASSYMKTAKSTTKYLGKIAFDYYYGKQKPKQNEEPAIPRCNSAENLNCEEQDQQAESSSPSSVKREKTCNRCHAKLSHAHAVDQYIPTLCQKTVVQLVQVVRNSSSEKAQQAAAISLLRSWREIQYALPTQKPTTIEAQMLCTNASLIADHSCWRVMLAKSAFMSQIDATEQKKILDLICRSESDEKQTCSCADLLCRDQVCNRGWSVEACVTLLSDEFFDCNVIFQSASTFLARESQCTVDLSFFIINLCWAIRFESKNDERRKCIAQVLLAHAKKDDEFFSDTFWRCMSAVHDLTIENRIRKKYVHLLKQLRQQNATLFDQLFAGKKMLQALDASGPLQAVQDSDNCFPEFLYQNSFRLPVNPGSIISALDLQSSKVMKSATRPMVVPCKPIGSDLAYKILLKREDIRKDDTIMSTVRYMRRLLETKFAVETGTRTVGSQSVKSQLVNSQSVKGHDHTVGDQLLGDQLTDSKLVGAACQGIQSVGVYLQRSDAKFCKESDQEDCSDRFGIVCYKCVPTSNNSGVIEMVSPSTTLEDVKQKYDLPLLQFIRSKNPVSIESEVLRERFMRSTAASSVITYLLGIGDRHLENIMLTRDGHLFHIDFGFVLGDDPKKSLIGSPAMRLTSEMVEALGGLESQYYERFQNLCTSIFNFLRREYTTIALLLMPLSFIGVCSVEKIEKEIQTRFIPTDSKTQANIQLCNTLNDSRGSIYVPSVVDLMHSSGKHASSLLTEPVMAIVSLLPKSIKSIGSSGNSSNSQDIDEETKETTQKRSNSEKRKSNSGSGSRSTTFSGRNSFERETAALGRGVQAPLRSPLVNPSPIFEKLQKESLSQNSET